MGKINNLTINEWKLFDQKAHHSLSGQSFSKLQDGLENLVENEVKENDECTVGYQQFLFRINKSCD